MESPSKQPFPQPDPPFRSLGPTQKGAQISPSLPTLSAQNSGFVISKRVDEVNLILSITDAKGRFFSDLTAEDLKLLDNHKVPEQCNYFQARTNLPLHVILAIDISSSVRARLQFEQHAASAFLRRILRKETDKAAIIAFGSTVQTKTD